MRDLKELMIQVEAEHSERLKQIRKELKSMPPGRIETLRQNGRVYYYHKSQTGRKGITKNKELLRKLARKRYLLEEHKILQFNLIEIKRAVEKYQSCRRELIMRKIPENIRRLPKQYFFKMQKPLKYDKNPYHEENLIYITNGGERVRSKSEQIIGNMLEEYGIEYCYDRRVEGLPYYADFTIFCGDGSIIIWEHFGLMDAKEEYRKHAIRKMEDYRRQGRRQWRDLICTYEEDMRDPGILRELIEGFLLPAMLKKI